VISRFSKRGGEGIKNRLHANILERILVLFMFGFVVLMFCLFRFLLCYVYVICVPELCVPNFENILCRWRRKE